MDRVIAVVFCLVFLLTTFTCDYCIDDVDGEPCGSDICYHGTCQSSLEELPFGSVVIHRCQCSDGWDGVRCEHRCDLECQEGYSCRFRYNLTMYDYEKNCYLTSDPQVAEEPDSSQPSPDLISCEDECINSKFTSLTKCDEHLCFHGVCNITSEDWCCTLDCVASEECHTTLQNDGSLMQSCQPRGLPSTQTIEASPNSTSCSAVPRNDTTECLPSLCYNGECRDTGNFTLKAFPGLTFKTKACLCDDGWFGTDCSQCCDIPCGNGSCKIEPHDDTMRCYCFPGYTGEFCEKETPPVAPVTVTPKWYWIVIGCSIGFIFIIIGISIYIVHMLWTKRNIFIMKIVRIFQSPECDGDGKLYDGCVSCSSGAGITFCKRQIIPELEKRMRYKLYVPCRDDSPGSLKAEEKIFMVQKSRRTILLISPEYLREEWPRFEYVLAQQEMLRLRHRIIPIILSDVTDVEDIDPVLGNMLRSLTCIVWPADGNEQEVEKFWKRLQLAMPKKKKQKKEAKKREEANVLEEIGVAALG
ncbi:hypothetical protein CAPTEDRAFT_217981 [Capitella teleta]|uniref:TIR domain-containing protein n=1 Tax=Capitella teleta TaxID=283909 RepID=R7T582_CAPTE|nr:hypothetical protein CAPTEDRAFT_217981 [Capitella teleta]|eukprot:ELT88218.1 hypothetical protein CAPTEDRAFT_217981 [Capitella teleta]